MTIFGINIGLALGSNAVVGATIGAQAAPQFLRETDFSLQIDVPPGVGRDQKVGVVTASGIRGQSLQGILQYEPPEVQSISTSPATVYSALEEPYNVTIRGRNFGPREVVATRTATVGGNLCPQVVSVSDSEILCMGVEAPWTDNAVLVDVQGQTGFDLSVFEYQPPAVISGLQPASGPTVGGTEVTITGNGLGQVAAMDIEAVFIGNRRCTSVSIPTAFAGQQIVCKTPSGTGTGHDVLVVTTRNGNSTFQGESRVSFSYDAPSVDSIEACQGQCGATVPSGLQSPWS